MNEKIKAILLKVYKDLRIENGKIYDRKGLKQIELDFDFIINISEGLSFIDITNKLISDAINSRKKEVIDV